MNGHKACPDCGGSGLNIYSWEPYGAHRCICTYTEEEIKKMLGEDQE